MAQEMFDLGDGRAVNFNPDGRFHGWLFVRHPDGQYVSIRKLDIIKNPADPLAALFAPKSLEREYDPNVVPCDDAEFGANP